MNKEKTREYYRKYNIKNRKVIAETHSIYYLKNKEVRCMYSKLYYQKNKAARNEYQKKYYKKNRLHLLKTLRDASDKFYHKNKKAILRKQSESRKNNPEFWAAKDRAAYIRRKEAKA